MRLGVFYFNPDYGIDIGELARALEERGFDSLYVPEHTHIPTPPHSVPRWRRAAEEVFTYPRSVCRLVLCRRGDENAAARHRDLPNPRARPYSDGEVRREPRPIVGRAVHLRHRRRLERRGKENHGAQYNTRFKLMRERILAMKALWTQEEASFHGEFVNFDPVWSWPKPAQRPHPPILLGGETDYTLRRVVEYIATAGSPARLATSPRKGRSSGCAGLRKKRGGTRQTCRSLCSALRLTRRLSPRTAKPASTRHYSKCPI